MRFSQKLVCSMLLVVVAFFALGGSALLHGDFLDRLAASAQQEQAQHGMACQVVENEMLALLRQGDGLEDAALAAIPAKLTAPPDQAHALLRAGNNGDTLLYSSFPAVDGLDAAEPGSLADTMPGPNESVITRAAGRVWRIYGSDLLSGVRLYTAFDLTEVFDARSRSLQRFLLLECAVLAGAALVTALLTRRLTRPLALLSRASRRIADGDYGLRTGIHTRDEIGELSENFDQMAAAVQEKVAALELSVRQREDFMGAFAHELKTPMTGILGYADLLRTMQPDPAEQREAAGAIFHEAKRLGALSEKLLQLLHLDEEPLRLAPVNLAEAAAEAARSARPALERAGARVRLDVQDAWVDGDGDLLADLALNLLTNAAKAGPGGEISLTVRQDGAQASLTVQDHGCGIPADQLARVTEPFYMVDKSRARRQGGSGLGLTLCQRIAEAHGGAMQFESEEGAGTTVTLRLPALAGGPPALPPAQADTPRNPARKPRKQNKAQRRQHGTPRKTAGAPGCCWAARR